MNATAALSSLTATYRYIKYVLGEARPSENFTLRSYLSRAQSVFERIAGNFGYELAWGVPSGYVKDAYQSRVEFSRLRDNYAMCSDSVLELSLWNKETGDEKTALLFIENSVAGYSLNCRLLSSANGFSYSSPNSIDFVMKDRAWKAHEAILREAALTLFHNEVPVKKRVRRVIKQAA